MCGIAGVISTSPSSVGREQLTIMISALAHRGPDYQQIYVANGIGLPHSRLRVIDLEGGAAHVRR